MAHIVYEKVVRVTTELSLEEHAALMTAADIGFSDLPDNAQTIVSHVLKTERDAIKLFHEGEKENARTKNNRPA